MSVSNLCTRLLINLGCAMHQFTSARETLCVFSVFFSGLVLVGEGTVAQSPLQTSSPLQIQTPKDGWSAGRNPEILLRSLPVLIALDSNSDGVISKWEIENASRSLQSIDKNRDGQLTSDELRPDFAAMTRLAAQVGTRGELKNSPDGRSVVHDVDDSPVEDSGKREAEMLAKLMKMDADRDGKLSMKELPERLQGFFESADQNEDGFATRGELGIVTARVARSIGKNASARLGGAAAGGQPRDPREVVGRMFEQRDVNKDGKLSPSEMPEQMAGRLQQIDADKDGFVSRQEMEVLIARFGNRSSRQKGNAGTKAGFNSKASGNQQAGGQVPKRPKSE